MLSWNYINTPSNLVKLQMVLFAYSSVKWTTLGKSVACDYMCALTQVHFCPSTNWIRVGWIHYVTLDITEVKYMLVLCFMNAIYECTIIGKQGLIRWKCTVVWYLFLGLKHDLKPACGFFHKSWNKFRFVPEARN